MNALFQRVQRTLTELAERFGPLPVERLRWSSIMRAATEKDLFDHCAQEKCLCELVDGILVEKAMGFFESYLAMTLGRLLGNFVDARKLGIVVGADGIMRLAAGVVRIPDVSFLSWDRFPNRQIPRDPIPDLVPDLAVEILSASNTEQEMQGKLEDYFRAGVRLVWYINPEARNVRVYTGVDQMRTVAESETLEGSPLLPGFSLVLRDFFQAAPPPGPTP